jgi:hypothetical protein
MVVETGQNRGVCAAKILWIGVHVETVTEQIVLNRC